jgi:hypothetical protein
MGVGGHAFNNGHMSCVIFLATLWPKGEIQNENLKNEVNL